MDPIPNGRQGAVTRPVVQTDVGIVSLDVGNQSLREEVGVPTTLAVVWLVEQYYAQYPTSGTVFLPPFSADPLSQSTNLLFQVWWPIRTSTTVASAMCSSRIFSHMA